MNNKITIPFLIIVVGIFIAYNIFSNRDNEVEKMNNDNEKKISMEDVERATGKEVVEDEILIDIEETSLEAVGSYTGSAVATRNFDGEKFIHEVRAKIGDPKEGKFYEGWLVSLPNFFSTGKMIKDGDEYILKYEANEDKSSFSEVVITEETEANGLDGKPEEHVLEGSFEK